ncbi:hypothetical protein [Gloeobacter kilaueensis]|uniref:Uncharacterized protein n=1 Tax=Gloeobacter kilaueensis (strain ATCC BAA-2537 / CCAP 1431/1 / ULC 316 / JS1) TaxID=1183438 RepID=U5QMU5_GLOK1|nr:hypothetical protein [Gloeobacter kilaueensis]AGY60223.1 hypothetical protein GKIL_3977 [Gloeobacter kilaueensis JS1]
MKTGSIAAALAMVLTGLAAPGVLAASAVQPTLSTAQVLDAFYRCTEKRPQSFCRDWLYTHFEQVAEGQWVARGISAGRPDISGFDWQQHIRKNP